MTLAQAVNFVKPCSEGILDMSAYLRIGGGYITAFDGTICAGHPIEEDFSVCPHADKLHAALKRVGESFSVTELDKGQLSIKGKKLRAVVPCVAAETLPSIAPDPNIAPIGEPLREAFKALVPLVKEDGERVVEYTFLINNGSVSATNGSVIVQYWHGINLPMGLIVPRKFGLLVSVRKGLVGFGFSDKSVTFWYDNGSWIRTSLHIDSKWPDIDQMLNLQSDAKPLPEDFWEGVQAIKDFSDENKINLFDGKIKSTFSDDSMSGRLGGVTFDCEGLIGKSSFDIRLLLLLKGVATSIDFNTHADRAPFFGTNLRGLIAKRK